MSTSLPLYAWATPAFTSGSPVDHTWVTSYDSRQYSYANIGEVAAAQEFYWYCWGVFHPQGGTPINPSGFLGTQIGDVGLARCLVLSQADSVIMPAARGTIFVYGVDGVCHQLANQVLFATGIDTAPLTVRNARGYMASTYLYGTYGLQQTPWADKITSCWTAVSDAGDTLAGERLMSGEPDDFEDRAREVLEPQDPKLLTDLLALRAEVMQFAAQAWPGSPPSAETLNARNQHLIDEAARLLGPDRFKAIFGFSPEEPINLVDPKIRGSEGPGQGGPPLRPERSR